MYRYQDLADRVIECSSSAVHLLVYLLLTRCDDNGILSLGRTWKEDLGRELGLQPRSLQIHIDRLRTDGLIYKVDRETYQVDRGDFSISKIERNVRRNKHVKVDG